MTPHTNRREDAPLLVYTIVHAHLLGHFPLFYCSGWIKAINLVDKSVLTLGRGLVNATQLAFSACGELHYVQYSTGDVKRITYIDPDRVKPTVAVDWQGPTDVILPPEGSGDATVVAVCSSQPALDGQQQWRYQWQAMVAGETKFTDIAGATAASLTVGALSALGEGVSQLRCRLAPSSVVSDCSSTYTDAVSGYSGAVSLSITPPQPPPQQQVSMTVGPDGGTGGSAAASTATRSRSRSASRHGSGTHAPMPTGTAASSIHLMADGTATADGQGAGSGAVRSMPLAAVGYCYALFLAVTVVCYL